MKEFRLLRGYSENQEIMAEEHTERYRRRFTIEERIRTYSQRLDQYELEMMRQLNGEIFPNKVDTHTIVKPKLWTRIKMKFQEISFWFKTMDMSLFFMIVILATLTSAFLIGALITLLTKI